MLVMDMTDTTSNHITHLLAHIILKLQSLTTLLITVGMTALTILVPSPFVDSRKLITNDAQNELLDAHIANSFSQM